MSNSKLPLFFLLLIILCGQTHGTRLISKPSNLLADGTSKYQQISPYLSHYRFSASNNSTCDETYGFLPCTSTALGNLFLIAVYGLLMFIAAKYLSNGSELLLEILGPGVIGGLFLPVLGALPDAMLILVSGLSGSTETAQSQVSVGMGLLAGSTVMLLTVIWGACIIVGKCDLKDSIAIDAQNTKGFSLTESGVSTDIWTSYAARILVISTIPFLVVQIPQALGSTSGRHLAVLIALIVSILLLISYCVYQILQPWIQKRKIAYVEHRHVIIGLLKYFKQNALGTLLTEGGEPDRKVIRNLFSKIDVNGDGYLSRSELTALIVGIHFDDIDLNQDYAVDKIMRDFDISGDSHIDEEEFVEGISRWLNRVKLAARGPNRSSTHKIFDDWHLQTKMERDLLDVGYQSDEAVDGIENVKSTTVKAVLLLLLGTLIAGVFADPLVDAVDNFSDATSIPAFFISFIVLPLATNSSEAVSAIIFASHNTRKTASLTYSELYGSATMNNLLCLSVFLAIVYIRGLTWDFSAEVLVILIVCILMGVFASFRTTFPLWTSIVALLLYPLSLLIIYVLDYILGWS